MLNPSRLLRNFEFLNNEIFLEYVDPSLNPGFNYNPSKSKPFNFTAHQLGTTEVVGLNPGKGEN